MNQERNFKGVWIPQEIYLDKNLNANKKILLTEIASLDINNKENSGCYASNQYFAEFIGVSEKTISVYIAELEIEGYIKSIKFDGRKRYIRSCIEEKLYQTSKNVKSDLTKSKGRVENLSKSTIINNTINNTSNSTINSVASATTTKDLTISKKPKKEQDLYTAIKDSFLAVTKTFPDYAREGRAINGLIKKLSKEPSPMENAKRIIAAFYDLAQRNNYIKGRGFYPSTLDDYTIYKQVLTVMKEDEDWEVIQEDDKWDGKEKN